MSELENKAAVVYVFLSHNVADDAMSNFRHVVIELEWDVDIGQTQL